MRRSASAIERSRRSSLASVRASPTGVVRSDVSRESPSSAECSAPSSASWIKPAAVVGRLLLVPVVEVDEAEQAVADEQGKADRRLDLVAADEGGVDLRRGVAGDQALACDREPHGRAVLVHAQLLGDLALLLVGQVAGELLVHVGQGVEEAFLRLAGGERGVVGVARLVEEKDGDELGAGNMLEVGDDTAEDRGEAGAGFDGWADHLVTTGSSLRRRALATAPSHEALGRG